MSEPLVEALRGSLVDAIHRGDLAVVDADGNLRGSAGDPRGKRAYWRSAAKPFQALPLVSSGAAERLGLSGPDLALVSGSHNGEPVHTERVASLLERIGGEPDDLACGAHPPLDPGAAADLQRAGTAPTALHSNCSGKHTGMLVLADELGAERRGYTSPDHPVQRTILDIVCRFADLEPAEVAVGIDGCGVPCFGTSVYHLAFAFARLMDPRGIAEPYAGAARTVREAMAAHPYLVAGRDRLDTDLMRAGAGALVSKGGAAGVQCVGVQGGLGIAVKIEDGAGPPSPARPGGVAVVEALHQLGLLDAAQIDSLEAHARPPQRSVAGEPVGEVRPVFVLGGDA